MRFGDPYGSDGRNFLVIGPQLQHGGHIGQEFFELAEWIFHGAPLGSTGAGGREIVPSDYDTISRR
jgi:hypothetical protein